MASTKAGVVLCGISPGGCGWFLGRPMKCFPGWMCRLPPGACLRCKYSTVLYMGKVKARSWEVEEGAGGRFVHQLLRCCICSFHQSESPLPSDAESTSHVAATPTLPPGLSLIHCDQTTFPSEALVYFPTPCFLSLCHSPSYVSP